MSFGGILLKAQTRRAQFMESKPCPKCGSDMEGDRTLQGLGAEVELVTDQGFRGDKIIAFHCEKCGYVELYRIKKNW